MKNNIKAQLTHVSYNIIIYQQVRVKIILLSVVSVCMCVSSSSFHIHHTHNIYYNSTSVSLFTRRLAHVIPDPFHWKNKKHHHVYIFNPRFAMSFVRCVCFTWILTICSFIIRHYIILYWNEITSYCRRGVCGFFVMFYFLFNLEYTHIYILLCKKIKIITGFLTKRLLYYFVTYYLGSYMYVL